MAMMNNYNSHSAGVVRKIENFRIKKIHANIVLIFLLILVIVGTNSQDIHGQSNTNTYNATNIFIDDQANSKSTLFYKIGDYENGTNNVTFGEIRLNPSSKELRIDISVTGSPDLDLMINRTVFDSKNPDGSDKQFTIFLGNEQYNQSENLKGFVNGPDYRIVELLNISDNVKNIKILGTQVENDLVYINFLNGVREYANIISFVIASGFVIIFFKIITRICLDGKCEKYRDLLLDSAWYPSLPRFQLLIWTTIGFFAITWVIIFKIMNGQFDFQLDFLGGENDKTPYNLLLLLGINGITYGLNKPASEIKYDNSSKKENPRPNPDIPLRTILYEEGRKSLTRIQSFGWTMIAATTFIAILVIQVGYENDPSMAIPDVPAALVLLMGIGQGVFIGTKFLSTTEIFSKNRDASQTPVVPPVVPPATAAIITAATKAAANSNSRAVASPNI